MSRFRCDWILSYRILFRHIIGLEWFRTHLTYMTLILDEPLDESMVLGTHLSASILHADGAGLHQLCPAVRAG